ncbi:MAG: murein biosynthesis integral membrane protein MurJ [Chloroflexota bacterium]
MTSSRALDNRQILKAAFVVLLGFVASGVLGFVRTGAFSATFGASTALDAFYAAQRIPELLFTVVAGGALGSSFIPVFARYLTDERRDHAWKLASAVMTLSASAAAVLALIMFVAAPVLVPALLVPGAGPTEQALTVSLTQLMLLTTVIFAISGLMMGILNAHQSFFYPALALSMNNIGLIIGALVIARLLPVYSIEASHTLGLVPILPGYAQPLDANIFGLAIGAILGALLHLVVQVPGLWKVRARLRLSFNWRLRGVREVLVLMGPRVLGLSVVQINFTVNVAFASAMVEGSQTALSVAWFLTYFTLGVIAQSMGTAVFPTLSALAADNDIEGYKTRLTSAMRTVLFLSFPVMIGLIVLGEPLVSVYERGEWTAQHTRATAWALAFFAVGIAGHSLLEVLSRAFYALSDTWTPVKVGIAAMLGNIALSVILIQIIGDPSTLARGPFAGLALANSIATLLESAALWWLLRRRLGGMNDRTVLAASARALFAALLMGLVILFVGDLLTGRHQLMLLVIGGTAGVITFFGITILMGMEEVAILRRRLPGLRASK